MISRKEHLTMEGLCKIVAIKVSMNRGLSLELKKAFPEIVPPSFLIKKLKRSEKTFSTRPTN